MPNCCGNKLVDVRNVIYTGPSLNCSNIVKGDHLDTILGKMDAKICSITPPSSSMKMLKFVISEDGTGSSILNFNGYKPAGDTLTDSRLQGAQIVAILLNGIATYDYGDDATPLVSSTIDFLSVGGLQAGAKVTIIYIS